VIGLAAVAVALGATGVARLVGGPEPSIADKAYAAVSGHSGILHFVAAYGPVEGTGPRRPAPPMYREGWINLAQTGEQRYVLTIGRRAVAQNAYDHNTVQSGTLPWIRRLGGGLWEPSMEGGANLGVNPVDAYKNLLKYGEVVSEKKIDYRGGEAYELKIVLNKPSYNLVGEMGAGDRVTYIVDRHSYFPLETRVRFGGYYGGLRSSARYPVFEILPDTAQNRNLLRKAFPAPYRPHR
jgi:hypothetical protein